MLICPDRRFLGRLATCWVPGLLLALGLAASPLVAIEFAGCPVTGRVVDGAGQAVAGATVVLWPRSVALRDTPGPSLEEYQPPSAVTGPEGRFRVEGVPDGSVVVLVEAPGRPVLAQRGRSTPCPVAGARERQEPRPAVDLGVLALPVGGSVTGRVVDPDGDPVVGARVEVNGSSQRPPWLPRRYWEEPHARAVTAADGSFRFDGLAAGSRISLRIEAEGHVSRYGDHGRVADLAPRTIALDPITLDRAGALRVRVVDTDTGDPISGARVMAERVGEERAGLTLELDATDEDGVRVLDGLVPGIYRLAVEGPGLRVEGPSEGRPVAEVRPGEITDLQVRGHRVPGRRVHLVFWPESPDRGPGAEPPLTGAEISLEWLEPLTAGDDEALAATSTYRARKILEASERSDWSVTFEDVPPGLYELRGSHPLYPRPIRRRLEVPYDRSPLQEVILWPAPDTGWELVTGQVIDESGAPWGGVRVSLVPEAGNHRPSAVTDPEGRFRIPSAIAGSYRAIAEVATGSSFKSVEVPWTVRRAPKLPTAIRTSGEEDARPRSHLRPRRWPPQGAAPREPLVITLPRGVEVVGRLEGLPSEALTEVVLRAGRGDSPGGAGSAEGYVEPDGTYRLPGVTPGTWEVTATWRAAGVKASFEVPEGLAAGASFPGPALAMPERYRITGQVLRGGAPYGEVRVRLVPEGVWRAEREISTSADGAGRFELRDLSAGPYRLLLADPSWGRVHQELLVVPGDVDLTRDLPVAHATGQVIDAWTGEPLPEAQVQLGQPGLDYYTSHSVPSWAALDLEARFDIGPLAEGRWSLRASAEGYLPGEEVITVEGHPLDGLVLAMEPTAGLDLLLRVEEGAALPTKVTLQLLDPATSERVAETLRHLPEARDRDQGAARAPPAGSDRAPVRVRWEDAPPGEWELRVTTPSGGCTVMPVTVEAVPKAAGGPVEILLEQSPSIAGKALQ